MTDKNKAEIVFVIDRSGSMSTIKADMEGGFATFLEEQKKLPGECRVSLYEFNTETNLVYAGVPIAEVPALSLRPGGGTALLDAMGRAITELGTRLKHMKEDERPGAVIFVTITDGEENSSKKFKLAHIRDMIRHQEERYQWQFMYLGASEAAFAEAAAMGYAQGKLGSFQPDAFGTKAVYEASSNAVANYRSHVQSYGSNSADFVLQELSIPTTAGIVQPGQVDVMDLLNKDKEETP